MSGSFLPRSPALDVSAAWQSQIARAQQQPWLLQELISHGQELFPRFSRYYAQLSALPRKTRRALKKRFAHSLAGAAMLLALSPGSGLAATLTVTNTTDLVMLSDGCSLREAVESINSGSANADCPAGGAAFGTADTIVFDSSVTGTITLGGSDLDITTDVTITGPGAPDLTIDGDGMSRIFNVDDGSGGTQRTVSISGLTLTGGVTTYFGGAIFNRETLTIDACEITGNSAFFGGGIYNNGSLTVTNSTLTGNSASSAGGASPTTYMALSWSRAAR